MTARQRRSIERQLKRLEGKIAKKRDEMRKIIGDFEPLVQSAYESAEEMEEAIASIQRARETFENACDTASQFA